VYQWFLWVAGCGVELRRCCSLYHVFFWLCTVMLAAGVVMT